MRIFTKLSKLSAVIVFFTCSIFVIPNYVHASATNVDMATTQNGMLPQGTSKLMVANDNTTDWVDNNGLSVSDQDARTTALDATDTSTDAPQSPIPIGVVYNWKLVETYSFNADSEKDAEMQIAGELYHRGEDDFGEWFMNAGLTGRNYFKVYRYTDSDAYNVYVKVVTKAYSDSKHKHRVGTFTDYFTN